MLVALGSTVLLSACGDGNNNTSEISNPEINAVDSSEIKTVNNPEVKTVENLEYTLSAKDYNDEGKVEDYKFTGIYTGEVVNNIPNGQGKFTVQNSQEETWTYTGAFKNGTFDGLGSVTRDSDAATLQNGTYTNGLFTPTDTEFYSLAQSAFQKSSELVPKAVTFISNHKNLFPCTTKQDEASALEFVDNTITYEKISKNIAQFGDRFCSIDNLVVQQIFETKAYGHNLTWILAHDNQHNYSIYYDGSLEIYEGDSINVVGLPINYSSFENVGGGHTLVAVLAGSIIDKA